MTQYSNVEEEVSPVVQVVAQAGLLIPRMIPVFQTPVNVSGTDVVNYCLVM